METTGVIQKVNELVSVLTDDQKQLLKDTINMGFWGDTDMEFRKENDEVETVSAYGYCTNDAKKAGNFKGYALVLIANYGFDAHQLIFFHTR